MDPAHGRLRRRPGRDRDPAAVRRDDGHAQGDPAAARRVLVLREGHRAAVRLQARRPSGAFHAGHAQRGDPHIPVRRAFGRRDAGARRSLGTAVRAGHAGSGADNSYGDADHAHFHDLRRPALRAGDGPPETAEPGAARRPARPVRQAERQGHDRMPVLRHERGLRLLGSDGCIREDARPDSRLPAVARR